MFAGDALANDACVLVDEDLGLLSCLIGTPLCEGDQTRLLGELVP